MDFEDFVSKMNTNELRLNLAKYLNNNNGETLYITRHNKLIGEFKVFSEEEKSKTELNIAKMIVAKHNLGK